MTELVGFEEFIWFGKALRLFNEIDREDVDLAQLKREFAYQWGVLMMDALGPLSHAERKLVATMLHKVCADITTDWLIERAVKKMVIDPASVRTFSLDDQ